MAGYHSKWIRVYRKFLQSNIRIMPYDAGDHVAYHCMLTPVVPSRVFLLSRLQKYAEWYYQCDTVKMKSHINFNVTGARDLRFYLVSGWVQVYDFTICSDIYSVTYCKAKEEQENIAKVELLRTLIGIVTIAWAFIH